MRDYIALLLEYGMVGMFDTITMMKGEANALLLEQIESVKNNSEENDGGGDGDGDGGEKEEEESYDDNDDNKSMSSSRSNCNSNPNSDSTSSSYVPIDERFTGRSYLDIQEDSKQQAAQMYHRFGVRAGDRVLLGKLFL